MNAFLTRVKIDAGELAWTKATDFSDRVQKSVLSAANISILAPWLTFELFVFEVKSSL